MTTKSYDRHYKHAWYYQDCYILFGDVFHTVPNYTILNVYENWLHHHCLIYIRHTFDWWTPFGFTLLHYVTKECVKRTWEKRKRLSETLPQHSRLARWTEPWFMCFITLFCAILFTLAFIVFEFPTKFANTHELHAPFLIFSNTGQLW